MEQPWIASKKLLIYPIWMWFTWNTKKCQFFAQNILRTALWFIAHHDICLLSRNAHLTCVYVWCVLRQVSFCMRRCEMTVLPSIGHAVNFHLLIHTHWFDAPPDHALYLLIHVSHHICSMYLQLDGRKQNTTKSIREKENPSTLSYEQYYYCLSLFVARHFSAHAGCTACYWLVVKTEFSCYYHVSSKTNCLRERKITTVESFVTIEIWQSLDNDGDEILGVIGHKYNSYIDRYIVV